MILNLVRCRVSEYGTFGKLYVNDCFECFTLEPLLNSLYPCVPIGSYPLTLNVVSPKYRNRFPYNTFCKGKVPRLLNVPGRDGILIHIGNFLKDTKGCILVGQFASLTRLYNSTLAFLDLYKLLKLSESHIINIEYL